jgi:hypothetical protein
MKGYELQEGIIWFSRLRYFFTIYPKDSFFGQMCDVAKVAIVHKPIKLDKIDCMHTMWNENLKHPNAFLHPPTWTMYGNWEYIKARYSFLFEIC